MAAEALEQSVLESKDKDQLLAIAKALGLKANSRTKKAEIIDSILEMTGSSSAVATAPSNGDVSATTDLVGRRAARPCSTRPSPRASTARRTATAAAATRVGSMPRRSASEPLAEWELTLDTTAATPSRRRPPTRSRRRRSRSAAMLVAVEPATAGQQAQTGQPQVIPGEGESRNRRRRRRRKGNRGTDGPQGDDAGARRGRPRVAAGRQRAGAGVRLRRHARRGLRLPARQGLPAEQGGLVHPGQARPPVRAAQGRPHHRDEPAGRSQREEPGAARRAHDQRCRPRAGAAASALRGPDGVVPRREPPPRGSQRPRQHDGADHRPRVADRQGPARHHRVAAEGGQDDGDEDDRQVDRAEQPRGQAHRPAHRRAARRGHRHAPPRAARRGDLLDVRPPERRAHARRRAGDREGQASRRAGRATSSSSSTGSPG